MSKDSLKQAMSGSIRNSFRNRSRSCTDLGYLVPCTVQGVSKIKIYKQWQIHKRNHEHEFFKYLKEKMNQVEKTEEKDRSEGRNIICGRV